MSTYVLRRVAAVIPVLFIVSVLVFTIVNLLPGDPVRAMFGPGADVSEDVIAQMRESLGLDRSLPERYAMWLDGLASGDFGDSIRTNEPVVDAIGRALPPTLYLGAASFLVAVIIALPLGTIAAASSNRTISGSAKTLSLLGISIPSFVIGIGLILVIAIQLDLLPAVSYTPPSEDVGRFLQGLALPALSEGLHLAAILSIAVYHNVARELSSDYVRTAHSKGLRNGLILRRHVLRNAMVGIAGVAAWLLVIEMGGTIVIEALYNWPGMGRLAYNAIVGRDYPVIQTIVLLTAVLFLVINLFVDLIVARVDPRLRLGRELKGT